MADLTLPRRATYADYCTFPDDGMRYELLEGAIFMTPASSTLHQFARKRLQRMLEDALEADGTHLVFNAPIDVILSDEDVVQPGLVVAARSQLTKRGVEGARRPLVRPGLRPTGRPCAVATASADTSGRRSAEIVVGGP
jgi:hypothetical protein